MKRMLCLVFGLVCFMVGVSVQASRGAVTFNFDDAWLSVYTYAVPLIEKYGIQKPTLFVITGYMNTGEYPAFMNRDQILDLHNRGWEIGSHSRSHSHLTQVDAQQLREEVQGSYDDLLKMGIHPIVFATPYGDYNASVVQAIMQTYRVHRRTWGPGQNGFNSLDHPDLSDISTFVVQADTPVDIVLDTIQRADNEGKWLVLCFHKIVLGNPVEYEYSYDGLERILKFVKEKGVRVVNFAEMAQ